MEPYGVRWAWHTTTPRAAASSRASRSPPVGNPAPVPAETIPLTPRSTAERTAAPSAPT
nr:hypothetical protein [Nocardioides humi]